jgi:hypothetical protein
MILSDLILTTRINRCWTESGLDSLDLCLNKQHFLDYPHKVEYQYNSRGFRDSEWPESFDELQNAIWCVGDSFTVGIGSPYEFTWPQVLAKASGRRCINVSMDGASNNWISRRAQQIIQEVNPTHMVVLWSYFHRRESPDTTLSDDARKLFFEKFNLDHDDLMNFINCYSAVKQNAANTTVIHGIIPMAGPALTNSTLESDWEKLRDPAWPIALPQDQAEFDQLPQHIKTEIAGNFSNHDLNIWFSRNNFYKNNQLIALSNLDYARDYHHFDKITSDFFVHEILKTSDEGLVQNSVSRCI